MTNVMNYQLIESASELKSFCKRISSAKIIAFDTEFVSEDRYLPELCLLQVAADDEIAILDTLKLEDRDREFWELLAEGDHVTVAHAGREEFRFCMRSTGKYPANFFDVQIGAGMAGMEYPAAYSTLVSKIAGQTLAKGETRSDWRRRPLSKSQLDYAALDVIHLESIYRKIRSTLEKKNRLDWALEEMEFAMGEWAQSLKSEHQWRKLSGIATLDSRMLAIAKSLWSWREKTACDRDMPARKILRDDLLIELARRKDASEKKIKSVRGMERRQYSRYLQELSKAIQNGLDLPKADLPERNANQKTPQLGQLGQFLTAAIGITCRKHKIAPGIFGSTSELRQLAAWRLGMIKQPETRLLVGWRRELIMPILDGLLGGKIGLRVRNAKSNDSLELIDLSHSNQEALK